MFNILGNPVGCCYQLAGFLFGVKMTMYFYDDFWESLQSLEDRADREAAAYAMLEYYFTGKSETNNPIASMAFGLVKGRIDKSITNQRNGAKGGAKKWQNASIANSEINTDATSGAFGNATTNSNPNSNSKTNNEKESNFPYECLNAVNSILGSTTIELPRETFKFLSRMEPHYTVNDVDRMVRFKYDEWIGDSKMRKNLNPTTLLKPEHFEKYIEQSRANKTIEDELSIFDEYI